ncbi:MULTISPECIES: DUF5709 domain-containing protein [Mycolicibacterium]|jgi:hypothetical protein|uniref:DUF5709 domain-containing protein n=1 Tax=Mycolicibacterium vanbaalenii (strain DSM 7251 / JCM 13017 / BCRC 16820 / KCTC 9966 / NRRL B-24157 / PYR-1) TaxID=350058 RepID=A1T4Y4_MYCVP|nr:MULTISPECIES: DUF5709 domain-containing protein [Mycolicibacterium]ABM12234.1 conserved hypothetical protein [Mycolicibacterium vanbaalenii PYR-1]MDW5611355.1 DUF5709 domain-containing protein [Mycolicibacterium sp. D5.8-2]PQP43504.1 hypothetical protein C6A88_23935 [Mycolicibacterium austroafricanum]QZY47504.1 DUF5709 domain-containing protein [Mycolicibacterium austroafricanum]UJL31231.1 hypothetical protein HZU38_12985 [Mycolicibacterium vanbaalenii]
MSTSNFGTGPAAGEYSTDPENQLQQEDTLIDRGVEDVLDEGYSPPERPYGRGAFGPDESMDQLLSEEEPDPAAQLDSSFDDAGRQRSDEAERDAEFPWRREVGNARAGRLVAPDLGFGEDTEDELVADDVGISGGAASAEEAAVHIIEDDR